jgi:hypothetical protein
VQRGGKRFIVRADESLTAFLDLERGRFALAANDRDACLVMGARRAGEAAAFRAFFLLAFPVDTASEFLPKRFGRQGLGHAKRTSTINSPEMSSPREIREGQNKRKLS